MAPPRYAVTCCGLAAFALMLALAANTCFAQPSPTSAADAALRTGAFDRAANLLEQQAKAGDAEAQYKLASLYRLGRGVPHDEAAAFRWMKSAAERGHAEAQLNLAKSTWRAAVLPPMWPRRAPGWRGRRPTAAARLQGWRWRSPRK